MKRPPMATVRHSNLSRNSSIGMIVLGLLTFLILSWLIGLVMMAVGLVMYWFYRKQTRAALPGGEPVVQKGAAD